MPACVAGTLIITFGRFTAAHSRRASAIVAGGVIGQVRGHLEADEAIARVEAIELGTESVGSQLDVLDGDGLIDLGYGLALERQCTDRCLVLGTVGDRLLENRRVRGDATQVVLFDVAAKFSRGDRAA